MSFSKSSETFNMSRKIVFVGSLIYGLANAAACVTADKRDVTRSVHIQQQTMAGKPVPVVGVRYSTVSYPISLLHWTNQL